MFDNVVVLLVQTCCGLWHGTGGKWDVCVNDLKTRGGEEVNQYTVSCRDGYCRHIILSVYLELKQYCFDCVLTHCAGFIHDSITIIIEMKSKILVPLRMKVHFLS